MKLIYAQTIYTPFSIIHNGAILIENKKIVKVAKKEEVDVANEKVKIIDAQDKIVTPGFIDLHIHGAAGYDVMDEDDTALDNISKFLVKGGTTSFLPTVYPKSLDKIITSIERINNLMDKDTPAAKIIGINLEGPYLNPEFAGAINKKYIREINLDEVKKLKKIAKDNIKIMTLAPEIKNADKLIEYLLQNNIIPAVGHTGANYEQFNKSAQLGVKYVTHMFNAMRGFHHRDTGLIGAILENDTISCEVICDGYHLHKEVVNILLKIKGIHKIILITDAIRCAGLKEGVYKFNEKEIILTDNRIIKKEDNKLVGSCLTMNKALKNLMKFVDIGLKQALLAVTLNQARILKIDNRKGIIAAGYDADLVILDRNFDVTMTIVEGKIVYERNNRE